MKYFIFLILVFPLVFADEFDDFSEESNSSKEESMFEFSGYLEFEQGVSITGNGAHRSGTTSTDYVLANRKFRLDLSKTLDDSRFIFKADVLIDQVSSSEELRIREIRFQKKISETTDISIGRQISTWGVADMLFINDLFPKNWVANFTGQDMEMLKAPSDSVRITNYFGDVSLDTVISPKFTADITPTGCRFGVYDPNTSQIISNTSSCTSSIASKGNDLDSGELALSLKRRTGSFELALYAYKGFFKSPKSLELSDGNYVGKYSRLSVLGASVEGQLGPGIFSFETGFYDSLDDKSGKDPLVQNSLLKTLFGYRMDLSSKFSFGIQAYQERLSDYSNYESSFLSFNPSAYAYRKKEVSSTYTLRMTYKMMQETLILGLFTYQRPEDKDSFTKLDLSKRLSDNLIFSSGINVFTGEDNYLDREFGMLRDDDNIYSRIKFTF